MVTRAPRPWKEIKEQVVEATKDYNEVSFGRQHAYIKIKHLSEWIDEHREKYIAFKDATKSQIRVWIQYAIFQMGWETWGSSNHNSKSVTYIVPWVKI